MISWGRKSGFVFLTGLTGLALIIGCTRQLAVPISPSLSSTPTFTNTISNTPTNSPTQTPTVTPVMTFTFTSSPTPSSPTLTPTDTLTQTLTFTPSPTPPNPGTIDDLEDNDNQLSPSQGRTGYWYTGSDGASNIVPSNSTTFAPQTPGNSGTFAARVTGNLGATSPYAYLGVNLVNPKGPYDITAANPAYTGVVFYVMGNVSGGYSTSLWFSISDTTTDVSSDTNGMTVNFTGSWAPVTVFFNQMQTQGWSSPGHVLDLVNSIALQWKVTDPSLNFDFWVDDIQFTTATPPPTPTPTATPDPAVIDDLEDNDAQILVQAGRNGYWSTAEDGLGLGTTVGTSSGTTVFGLSPGLNASSFAARITGVLGTPSGSNYPFASMQANFVTVGSYSIPGGYTGVAFDIKASFTGPCIQPYVRFQMVDGTTLASADANGINLTLNSGAVTHVVVYFNQMLTTGRSGGVSQNHALDTASVSNLQWQVTYPGATYDVTVDNVQFVSGGPGTPSNPLPGSSGWAQSLIDDCEQGVNNCLLNQGRGGPWFTFDNPAADTICPTSGSAFIMHTPGDLISPLYCARMTGTMGSGGYPGMGVHFLPSDGAGKDQIYNINTAPGGPYTSFKFYAKFATAGNIAVMGADAGTDPNIAAPTCATGGTGGQSICNANHVVTVAVGTAWAQYTVAFTSMIKPSWNSFNPQATFDAANSIGIQWQISAAGAYDFSVDDITFF